MYLRSPWHRARLDHGPDGPGHPAVAWIRARKPGHGARPDSLSPTARTVVWLLRSRRLFARGDRAGLRPHVSFSKSQVARAHMRLRAWFDVNRKNVMHPRSSRDPPPSSRAPAASCRGADAAHDWEEFQHRLRHGEHPVDMRAPRSVALAPPWRPASPADRWPCHLEPVGHPIDRPLERFEHAGRAAHARHAGHTVSRAGRASERWLARLPVEPAVMRVGTRIGGRRSRRPHRLDGRRAERRASRMPSTRRTSSRSSTSARGWSIRSRRCAMRKRWSRPRSNGSRGISMKNATDST